MSAFSVVDGGYEVFNAMNYTPMGAGMSQYFQQKQQQFMQNATAMGQQYLATVQQQVDRLSQFDMSAMANALARKNEQFWNNDVIRPMTSMGALQHASMSNIRWLMAEPTYRAIATRQQAEGWGKHYVNVQGNDIGVDQYDYRRVYHGLQAEVEGDQFFRNFMEEAYEDDTVLTDENRFDIIESHWHLEAETAMKDRDPGDPWNSSL